MRRDVGHAIRLPRGNAPAFHRSRGARSAPHRPEPTRLRPSIEMPADHRSKPRNSAWSNGLQYLLELEDAKSGTPRRRRWRCPLACSITPDAHQGVSDQSRPSSVTERRSHSTAGASFGPASTRPILRRVVISRAKPACYRTCARASKHAAANSRHTHQSERQGGCHPMRPTPRAPPDDPRPQKSRDCPSVTSDDRPAFGWRRTLHEYERARQAARRHSLPAGSQLRSAVFETSGDAHSAAYARTNASSIFCRVYPRRNRRTRSPCPVGGRLYHGGSTPI